MDQPVSGLFPEDFRIPHKSANFSCFLLKTTLLYPLFSFASDLQHYQIPHPGSWCHLQFQYALTSIVAEQAAESAGRYTFRRFCTVSGLSSSRSTRSSPHVSQTPLFRSCKYNVVGCTTFYACASSTHTVHDILIRTSTSVNSITNLASQLA